MSLLGSVSLIWSAEFFSRMSPRLSRQPSGDTCGSRLASACEKVPRSALARSLRVRRVRRCVGACNRHSLHINVP